MRPTPRTDAIGIAKLVSPMLDEHRLRDRERLRQAQRELVPLPALRIDVERAAELADFAGDHVHADAAAGECG